MTNNEISPGATRWSPGSFPSIRTRTPLLESRRSRLLRLLHGCEEQGQPLRLGLGATWHGSAFVPGHDTVPWEFQSSPVSPFLRYAKTFSPSSKESQSCGFPGCPSHCSAPVPPSLRAGL